MKVGPEHCWMFFILFQLVLAYLDSKKCEERLIVKWPSLTNAFRNSFGWKNPGFRSHLLGWAFLSITMISTEWIMDHVGPKWHPGCHQMHPASGNESPWCCDRTLALPGGWATTRAGRVTLSLQPQCPSGYYLWTTVLCTAETRTFFTRGAALVRWGNGSRQLFQKKRLWWVCLAHAEGLDCLHHGLLHLSF